MAAIALIGSDGAGKTTVARALIDSNVAPMRYLYMGILPTSANHALPTTRLAYRLKARESRKAGIEISGDRYPSVERGLLGTWARVLMRMSEEWYRQLVSWLFQLRGFVVVYDRHFVFEYELNPSAYDDEMPLAERIHRWVLRRLYPRPDLVILLDAPSQQLYRRKEEQSVDRLANLRMTYLARSDLISDFVIVDASQSLELVIAEIFGHFDRFLEATRERQEPIGRAESSARDHRNVK